MIPSQPYMYVVSTRTLASDKKSFWECGRKNNIELLVIGVIEYEWKAGV